MKKKALYTGQIKKLLESLERYHYDVSQIEAQLDQMDDVELKKSEPALIKYMKSILMSLIEPKRVRANYRALIIRKANDKHSSR